MLSLFVKALQKADLRRKILITLGLIIVFRIGAAIPVPGISVRNVAICAHAATASGAKTAGVLGMLNLMSGQALLRMSVFALGIMPYITATIIMQLLTTVIPRLETIKQEGKIGQKKIKKYTRYLTVGLALIQSVGYVEMANNGALFNGCGPLIPHSGFFVLAGMVIIMTLGAAVLMWFGELITERGIGNGMSVLIFVTVISVIPGEVLAIYREKGIVSTLLFLVMSIVLMAFIVFMEQAQRRITTVHAKRIVGRRMIGGATTYLPIKVNQAGVIPAIFASSLLSTPVMAAQLFGGKHGWAQWILRFMGQGSSLGYLAVFFALMVGFAYFYASITFNPAEVSDNLKKSGSSIPGIRPGPETTRLLSGILYRLTAAGSIYLGAVAILPLLVLRAIGMANQFPFSGTSLLIMVAVGLDIVNQLESKLSLYEYDDVRLSSPRTTRARASGNQSKSSPRASR